MRIHTDVLSAQAIYGALHEINCAYAPDTYLDTCDRHGSRSRKGAFEVKLRGAGVRHTRRPNPGRRRGGSSNDYAATYDDWGWFLAALFDRDPAMIVKTGYYADREHFHQKTRWAYDIG